MKEVSAYQTADGKLFHDMDKAIQYEQDLIGAELDALLLIGMRRTAGNVTRVDQYRMITSMLDNKKELSGIVYNLNKYLNGDEE